MPTREPRDHTRARKRGEYAYQIRLTCTDTTEFARILAELKQTHRVREVRSRLILHDILKPQASG